jgi:deoxyribodipyrimidine photo-lyase
MMENNRLNSSNTNLFWHRRDLRIADNSGLFKALTSGQKIQAVFIFDSNILNLLSDKEDARITFIYREISRLKTEYQSLGADLLVLYGDSIEIIPQLALEMGADAVFTNRDYEPKAVLRDTRINELLATHKIKFIGAKDHVIFEKDEITKGDGSPYTIYTPYANKWREKFKYQAYSPFQTENYFHHLAPINSTQQLLSLEEMGFKENKKIDFPPLTIPTEILQNYHETRDYPYIKGTSKLSIHLRFGTISIRKLVQVASTKNPVYLNELIWRDFYQMIIHHFPQSVKEAFKLKYERIEWEHNEIHFNAWCEGKTGYPLVDAGMRELNNTGFMHNRVRMVVASFLCKHLLLDWKWGAAYFAEKLLDYEEASNIGGWQWVAGCGCDAAPYFRVFNPTLQQQKFDPKFDYIKKWVPEFGTIAYPEPIIEHTFARDRVIIRYKYALNELA